MSKTFKITRIETIQQEVIVQADNEEQALPKFEDEKDENPQILSSDTVVKEIKKGKND